MSRDEQVDGSRIAAKILNSMPPSHKRKLLARIKDKSPEAFRKIEDNVFVFEDIKNLTDQGLQRLIKEVDHNDLVLSLKLADEEVKRALFRNMSQRKLSVVMEDLSLLKPTPVAEVEEAQKRIILTIDKPPYN